MKTCPYCAEEILDEAIKCKHCGEWLNTDVPYKPSVERSAAVDNEQFQRLPLLIKCKCCNHIISRTAIICPACGKNNEKDEQSNNSPFKSGLKVAVGAAAVVLMGPAGILGASSALLADSYSNRSFKKIARENAAIDSFYSGEYMVLVTDHDFILTYNMFGSGIYRKIPRNKIGKVFIDEEKARSGNFLMSGKAVIVIKYIEVKDQDHEVVKSLKLSIKAKASSDLANHAIKKFKEYMI